MGVSRLEHFMATGLAVPCFTIFLCKLGPSCCPGLLPPPSFSSAITFPTNCVGCTPALLSAARLSLLVLNVLLPCWHVMGWGLKLPYKAQLVLSLGPSLQVRAWSQDKTQFPWPRSGWVCWRGKSHLGSPWPEASCTCAIIQWLLEASPYVHLRDSGMLTGIGNTCFPVFSWLSLLPAQSAASCAKSSVFVKWSRRKRRGRFLCILRQCLLVCLLFWCHLAQRKKRCSQQSVTLAVGGTLGSPRP